MPGERPGLRTLLLLSLLPLALIGPALLPGRRFLPQLPAALAPLSSEDPAAAERARERQDFLTSDRLFPTLTDQLAIRAELRAGRLPTWEPLLGAGLPLFAGTIAGAAYPPSWLAVLLPPDVAAGPLAILALLLPALGLWLFLRRLGLSSGACAVGALALQAGGFGIVNLHYFMKVDAAGWLPWSLWAVEGLVTGRQRAGLWLALSVGLSLLAGFPPIALFALVATAAYGAARIAMRARAAEGARPAHDGARIALFLALGLGIGAWQMLPSFEASAESFRSERGYDDMRREALPAATSLGLVAPDLFGQPTAPRFAPNLPVAWYLTSDRERALTANALEWSTYAGLTVLVLALVALAATPRRAAFPALGALLALGFAQGWPLVSLLYHVPGLALGAPSRALALAWVLWPWLAALGVEALRERRPRALGVALGACTVLAATASAVWLGLDPAAFAGDLEHELAARHGIPVEDVRALIPPESMQSEGARLARLAGHTGFLAAALLAAFVLLLRKRGLLERWAFVPPLAVIAFEALSFAPAHLVPRRVDGPLFPESAALAAVAEAAGDGRVLRVDRSASGVSEVERLARPNLLQPYGVADLTPFVALTPRRPVELFEALDPRARYRSGFSRLSDPELLDRPLLDLARVTAVLSIEPLAHPRLAPVLEQPGFCVYRRSGALGIARVVPRAVVAGSDAQAIARLTAGEVDLASETLLAPGADPGPASVADFRAGTLRVERPQKSRLDIAVTGSSGGWLVMHETWAPGWKATVNGEDAEVVRADHAFRAVRIPAGDSLVRTKYEPWSLRIGFTAALVALAAAAWLSRRG